MTKDTIAAEVVALQDGATLVAPFSGRYDGFGIGEAYGVSRAVLAAREAQGWRRAGRKIGFTNRDVQAHYGVHEPILGYMYDRTVVMANDATEATLSLDGLSQPMIEPEIFFRLRDMPPLTDDAEALLACIEAVGHGFEIVQCHFPDWKFAAADTVADGGLHGRYVSGPELRVDGSNAAQLVRALSRFRLTLLFDGVEAAAGGGENVLDSPLNALAALVELMASLPEHPPLAAGELITTGSLTAAMPIARGQTWSTRIDGLALPGLMLRLR